MRKHIAAIFLLLGFCTSLLWAQANGITPRAAAAKIDARYNGMKSLRADFTENYSGAGIDRSRKRNPVAEEAGKDALGLHLAAPEDLSDR